jgi:hypothetical protein
MMPAHEAEIEVPETILRDAFEPLNIPTPDAGPTARIFCTPARQISLTREAREHLAKALAAEIATFLASKDTEMRYTRAQQEEWRRG